MKKLVEVNRIRHWQNDSLYIKDPELFYKEYSSLLDCGIYNNLKSGTVDICGINYYAPSLIAPFISRLCDQKPLDYEVLVQWLNNASAWNGFYILGI